MNVPFLRPLGCPAGVDPHRWREALTERIEELHEVMLALIAALDAMDGDTDLEPSLGYSPCYDQLAMVDAEGGDPLDEGEPHDWDDEDSDPPEDSGDREHSHGWRTWAYLDDLAPTLAEGWCLNGSSVEEEA